MRRMLWTLMFAVCAAPLWAQGGTIGGNSSTASTIAASGVTTGTFPSGTYSFTGATVLTGGAGNMTILAGTGNSRSINLQSTNQVGTARSAFSAGNNGTKQFINLYSDTLTFLTPTTSAGPDLIRGGASNLTFLAGTGASRQFAFQTTTSGSVATTFLRGNEVQQTLFADGAVGTPGIGFIADSILGLYRKGTAGASDSLMIAANGVSQLKLAPAGVLLLPLLPAEGSTKNAMCWDGTTFNVTQNAAATCTVSSRRFKTNIRAVPLDTARAIVGALHASMYDEKVGGRKAFGIIAEEADSANHRLASRDSKGLVTSTNYEEISAILLTIVKDQQRQLDSLKTVLRRARP